MPNLSAPQCLRGAALSLLLLSAGAAHAQTGIGTTSPDPKAALDITSTSKGLLIPRMDSAARAAIAAPPDGLMVFQTNGRTGFWYAFGGTWLYIPDKTKAGDNLGNHTATTNVGLNSHWLSNAPANANGLRIDNAGNVGVGTATPAAPLDVNGAALVGTRLHADYTNTNDGTFNTGGSLRLGAGATGEGIASARTVGSVNRFGLDFYTAAINRLAITQTGNVGIGIAIPTSRFEVAGTAGTPNVRLQSLGGTGNRVVTADLNGSLTATQTLPTSADYIQNQSAADQTASFRINGNGFVGNRFGIGTTAASGRFQVATTTSGTADDYLFDQYGASGDQAIYFRRIGGTPTTPEDLVGGEQIGAVAFGPRFNGVQAYSQAYMRSFYRGNGITGATDLRFGTSNAERVRIDTTGNVGIGQPNPTQKLEVLNGSVLVRGEGTGFLTDNGANARVGLLKYSGHEGGIWRLNNQDFEVGRVSNSVTPMTALPGTPDTYTTDLYVSSAGRVGIGTTTPVAQLANTALNTIGSDANGGNGGSLAWSASQAGYVGQFYNAGTAGNANGLAVKVDGTSSSAIALDVSRGVQTTAGTPLLTVRASGRVGIGTSGPGFTLDVNSPFYMASRLTSASPTGTWLNLDNTDTGGRGFQFISTGSGNGQGPGKLVITEGTGGTTAGGFSALTFDAATRRFGIGTFSPARRLHVAGGMRVDTLAGTGTRLVTASATGDIGSLTTGATNGLFWGLTGNAGTNPATNFIGTTDAQDLVFRANNVERLRLTTSGALYQTIANNNTFLGLNAGSGINGTAGNNVYVGVNAGESSPTGTDNVAIGLGAGQSSTITGSAMLGTLAGFGSAGLSNTLIGGAAGYGASGSYNAAVGYLAGLGLAGNFNTVLGTAAGYPAGTMAGGLNTIVGYSSAAVNTGGEDVVVGASAAPAMTGSQNTVVGTIGAAALTTGAQNTFLGYRAGNDVSSASGNTFVGNLAGRFTATGSNNTMLGAGADVTNAAGNDAITNATAVGANAHVTQSNSLVLGATGVNVGIGTTAPAKRLHVDANSDVLRVDNLAQVSATNNYLVIDGSGNVGKTTVENVAGQIIRLGFNATTYFENNGNPALAEAALRFNSHSTAALMGNAPNGAANFINTITGSSIANGQVVVAGNGTVARTTDQITLPAGVYRVTVRLVGSYVAGASGATRSVFVKCIVNNNEYSLVETLNATGDGVTVHNEVSDYLNLSATSTVDFSVRALRNFATVARLSPGTGQSYRSLLLIERVR